MGFFQQIEGAGCILVRNGISYQVPVYTRDGVLFAKYGSGFIRLMEDGSTSAFQAKFRFDFLAIDVPLARTGMGTLVLATHPDAKPLLEKSRALLEAPSA